MSADSMLTMINDSILTTSGDSTWYDYDVPGSTLVMPATEPTTYPEPPELAMTRTSTSAFVSVTDINEIVPSRIYSPDIVTVISIVVGVVIFLTVIGNLLVIVSFCTTPTLRTYNNYFILGLAIADLLAGAVDMPIYAVTIIIGQWQLGKIFCDIFTYFDHVSSHISILLVTLISLDRCVGVTYPLRHRQRWRRRSRAIFIIAVSYIFPVIIWLPLTALWQVIQGFNQRSVPEDACKPLYIDSVIASVIFAIVFLFIPFTVTAILCARIYVVINNFCKGRKKMMVKFEKTRSAIAEETTCDNETLDTTASVSISTKSGYKEDEKGTESSNEKDAGDEKKDRIGRASLKGVRTLVFIVTAMGIAWFPAVIIVITSSVCSNCVPGGIYSMVIFWGYTNSLMNPICYAMADKDFRDCFIRILSLGCIKKVAST